MTLYKKDGMWISDWSNKSDSYDAQGCRERQREQTKKAKALVANMKTQGWKMIPMGKTQQVLIDNYQSFEKAIANHDKDIKKKWGQKKVKMWKNLEASGAFLITEAVMEYEPSVKTLGLGELGGYSALLNKGNEYRLIFTYGSDDDEAGYWSKPVTQIVFKSTAKPRAKAPAKKPAAKKPKAKASAKKARPSPSQSAAATKVGVRKRGNDGFMWEVKKNKNGVHRWARDNKSTKRAEDYWYWK